MAAKKKTTAAARLKAAAAELAALDAGAPEVTIESAQDDAEADALESLAALGGDADTVFVVTCVSPLDRKGKVDEVDREDIPELWQYLRDKYGPGKYTVHAVTNGAYVRGSRRKIEISPLAAPGKGGAANGGAALPVPAPASDWERWQREERARQAEREERAREDRKFMLSLLVPALPGLLTLLRPPSLADQAAAMQALGVAGGARGMSEDKVLDVLVKGMELAKEAQGGNAETWPGMIRETLKDLAASPLGQSVMDRVANRQAGPPAAAAVPRVPYQPPPAPGGPAAAPAPAAPAVTSAALTGNAMFDQLLNKLANELLEFAQNGCAPDLAAEALVAKVPRMVRAMLTPEQLREWLTHPNWWAYTVKFRPALEPYQGFCDDVRQELFRQLLQTDEGAPEETVQ